MIDVLLLAVGIVLLVAGGQLFVTGAARLARALGVSPIVVGVVVIGFGTSAPEMVASVLAAVRGSPGIAYGNLVGSNISNIGLVLGLGALIRPMTVAVTILQREALLAVGGTLLFVGLVLDTRLSRPEGLTLILAFCAGMGWLLWLAWRERRAEPLFAGEVTGLVGQTGRRWTRLTEAGRAMAGLALVLLGAELAVRGGAGLALAAGVDEGLVGLTVVALGTSLPELVTAVVAAIRREGDLVIGNVLGSNVFNLLLTGGAVGIVTDQPLAPAVLNPGLPVLLLGSVVLLPILRTGLRLVRWEGALLLAYYAVYVGLLARQL